MEEKKIQRLGSVQEISLDIRIIAATNRNLQKMVAAGTFREDLYYRLNVITINLPSLAERQSDIMLLAEKFINRFAIKSGKKVKGITPEAADILVNYAWPGNVRELENMIERAVVMSRSDCISKEDLTGLTEPLESTGSTRRVIPLVEMEKEHIAFCLDQLGWNLGLCAEKLGIHRNTLRSKIKEYNLKSDQE